MGMFAHFSVTFGLLIFCSRRVCDELFLIGINCCNVPGPETPRTPGMGQDRQEYRKGGPG